MVKKAIFISISVLTLLSVIGIIFLDYHFPLNDFDQIKELMTESGKLGPFLIVLLQTVQVIFVPIPGQLTGIISGYFFGPFLGTLYSIIGLSIGTFIAFYLSRKLGKPFVKKIISEKTLRDFSHISDSAGLSAIFLVFLLPMFPDDAICFLCGLTKFKIRTLMAVAVLGRLPGCFMANVIGNGVAISKMQTLGVFAIAVLIFLVFMYFFHDKVENKLHVYVEKKAKVK